jgi:Phospholipase_D-nuclease N-terminal
MGHYDEKFTTDVSTPGLPDRWQFSARRRRPVESSVPMLHLTSGPALIVEAGFAVFCFIDVLISPEAAVRWVPRWAWVLAILVFPLCACLLWLIAGRSWRSRVRTSGANAAQAVAGPAGREELRARRGAPSPASSPASPAEPDAGLALEMWAIQEEHEHTLTLWEADLRRREAALRETAQHPAAGQQADAA